ncbi:MAG TPA: ABC transporter ATP-binding protein [Candidatus Obscuribacterales bacterium]
MSRPAVEVVNVTRSFGEVQALKGISLTIGEGAFFSLLGPSGCGKTTLLRMIAGLDQPTTGQVIVGGKDMSKVPPDKRPVNTVFQSYALFPHMTVFENVAFGLKIAGKLSKAEIAARVDEALSLVRLPDTARRYPKELSGGQQQRIAFARAIVNRPLVLLLDEPLSALDPRIREEMQTELARFKRELGITFVMVTHDQSEAFALSDTIAVFNAGTLEQVGSAQEIYERPKSAFVADFIGHTNVLHGKVIERDQGHVAVAIDDNLRLVGMPEEGCQLNPGDSVVVWIRTHNIDFAGNNGTDSGGINKIQAKILHRSYQGDASEFVLDAHGRQIIASVEHTKGGETPSIGDSVVLRIEPRFAHVLK